MQTVKLQIRLEFNDVIYMTTALWYSKGAPRTDYLRAVKAAIDEVANDMPIQAELTLSATEPVLDIFHSGTGELIASVIVDGVDKVPVENMSGIPTTKLHNNIVTAVNVLIGTLPARIAEIEAENYAYALKFAGAVFAIKADEVVEQIYDYAKENSRHIRFAITV